MSKMGPMVAITVGSYDIFGEDLVGKICNKLDTSGLVIDW
jgi:hypothetical protein